MRNKAHSYATPHEKQICNFREKQFKRKLPMKYASNWGSILLIETKSNISNEVCNEACTEASNEACNEACNEPSNRPVLNILNVTFYKTLHCNRTRNVTCLFDGIIKHSNGQQRQQVVVPPQLHQHARHQHTLGVGGGVWTYKIPRAWEQQGWNKRGRNRHQ